MKDNPVTTIVRAAQTAKTRIKAELHRLLDGLSSRQRLIFVCGMCILFIVVDVYYIVTGFAGKNNIPLEVEHIERVDIHPEKSFEYDSFR